MKTQIFTIVFLVGAMLCSAQSIERSVVASAGDYFEGAGVSMSWTLGEIATETFTSGNVILTQGFQQPNLLLRLYIDVKAFMEGPYNASTDLMETTLNTMGYIPLQQPYNPALPYYGENNPVWLYTGGEIASLIQPGMVDWIIVQLRDADSPSNATSDKIISTMAAFIKEDGTIVDKDGSDILDFPGTFSQNLYVVIFHRNHLGVISSMGLSESGGIYSYDFTTGASQALGGANGHKELEPGVWGMVSADGNGNGLIQNTDETTVWKADLGQSGYKGGDFDMNGLVQNTDETNYWKVNLGAGGQTPGKLNETGYQSQVPK
ncbi:MAG: hypothetical protein KQI35_05625 [Bacteroidetes bacterium]|nr:hypothetical protein [Bacteroidota bacterium]